MKNIRSFILALTMLSLMGTPPAWGASDVLPNKELAVLMVNDYLAALTRGDLETLKSILDGPFLSDKKQLLNNPDYRDFLQEFYAQARFEILGSRWVKGEWIEVDTRINFSEQNKTKIQFLLKEIQGRWRIISEKEL